MSESKKFQQLRTLYGEIADLCHTEALLSWDQQTYMPPKASGSRAQQIATLSGIIHEKLTTPEMGELIGELESTPRLSVVQKAFLREMRFNYDRKVLLPGKLVKELARETAQSFGIWEKAKNQKSFKAYRPSLEKVVNLTRQVAECYGYKNSPWDALATDYERGLTAEKVENLLGPLRDSTISLIDRIKGSTKVNIKFLDQKWDLNKQREFGVRVASDLGYDFAAGRQDVSAHPFTTSIGQGDVRITTRYSETNLVEALLATVHEAGHGMYDQGINPDYARTPLHDGTSLGIHESQSRLWEVRIGHSKPFWEHYLPHLRQYFPGQLDEINIEHFYRGINQVRPGFIRIEADEVTYNLHIIIRFELEMKILNGDLEIQYLPEAWNALYKKYLGLDVPNDAVGCMQDVHWACGSFGYFPTYSMGNIYNAMLLETMENEISDMWQQVSKGYFVNILAWLQDKIYQHGRVYLPEELMKRITGKPISSDSLVQYLNSKYSTIYGL
jgi:carboxypeptidase Taq